MFCIQIYTDGKLEGQTKELGGKKLANKIEVFVKEVFIALSGKIFHV
jgi:hypothetical protein